jgi:hypothetical protein
MKSRMNQVRAQRCASNHWILIVRHRRQHIDVAQCRAEIASFDCVQGAFRFPLSDSFGRGDAFQILRRRSSMPQICEPVNCANQSLRGVVRCPGKKDHFSSQESPGRSGREPWSSPARRPPYWQPGAEGDQPRQLPRYYRPLIGRSTDRASCFTCVPTAQSPRRGDLVPCR